MTNPFTFDDFVSGSNSNITTTHVSGSAIDNQKSGIVNLGSDTTGQQPGARANYVTVFGNGCTARGDYALVGGYMSVCDSASGVACGNVTATVTGSVGAIALGNYVQASGDGAVALGGNSYAYGTAAVAIGNGAYANGTGAVALGLGAAARNVAAVAIGEICNAYGPWAMCFGIANHAFAPASMCLNEDTIAFGQRSLSAGFASETASERATAIGSVTRAEAFGSICLGLQGVATADGQLTLSGGTFLNAQETTGGDAQGSWRVLRARTFGYEVGEVGVFAGGVSGNIPWAPSPGRSYKLKANVVVAATLMPSHEQVTAAFSQEACVRCSFDGAVSVQAGQTVCESTDPSSTASWSFSVQPDGTLSYCLGASRAKSNAEAKVEFDEVTFQLESPTDISGCSLWLESQRGITLTSGSVSSWADQSGHGNDFVASRTLERPSYVPNVANTQHAVRFDGVANAMTCAGKTVANALGTGEYTMCVVYNVFNGNTAADPKQRPCVLSDTAGVLGLAEFVVGADATTWHTDASLQNIANVAAANTATPNILAVWYGAQTNMQIFRAAGNMQETGNPIQASSLQTCTGTLQLGVNFDGSAPCRADIFEIIAYDRQLSYQERNQLLGYIHDKWCSPQFDPLSDGRTALWYRADVGVTLSGSSAIQWAATGSLYADPAASTSTPAGAAPAYIQSDPAYGYQPTLQFSGNQALFGSTALTSSIAQPYTVYVVGEADSSGPASIAGGVVQSPSGSWGIKGSAELDSSLSSAKPNVVAAVVDGPYSQLYVFGMNAAVASGDCGSDTLTEIAIGAADVSGSIASAMSGKVAEVIVRNGVDYGGQLTTFGNYLKRRYGL